MSVRVWGEGVNWRSRKLNYTTTEYGIIIGNTCEEREREMNGNEASACV